MLSHEEIVAKAMAAMGRANRAAIVEAFVGSLSTRNLPARSAFGSYVVLQKFKAHPYQGSQIFTDHCAVCGLPPEADRTESEERVANYPFQVQHTDVQYAAFDLETFAGRVVDEPTQENLDCLGELLDALRALPADAQLTELGKSIGKAIKSNKHERRMLLETFGYAGILCPTTKHHYDKKFVTYEDANSDQPKKILQERLELSRPLLDRSRRCQRNAREFILRGLSVALRKASRAVSYNRPVDALDLSAMEDFRVGGNRNVVVTDDWSNPASRALYEAQWPGEPDCQTAYHEGRQCGGCSFFAAFDADWGLCAHPQSRHRLETVFEHFTCPAQVPEGWGPHSFTADLGSHCLCGGEADYWRPLVAAVRRVQDAEPDAAPDTGRK